MRKLLIPLSLLSLVACSNPKEEVVKTQFNETLGKKFAHLSYVKSEFADTKESDIKKNPELAFLGLSELAETPVKITVKTNVDCQLMAIEDVNPLKDSKITCEPVNEKTNKDAKYVKKTILAFPPKRIMASAQIIKAGEEFEIAAVHMHANTGKKIVDGVMFRDAQGLKKQ